MLKLARWTTTHRKYVLIGWVALLLVVNAFAQSAGTSYSNNFTLPNSDAQRAADLLAAQLPGAGGRPRHDRLQGLLRHGLRPRGTRADERDVRAGVATPARHGRRQPLCGRVGRQGDLGQRTDRVRDGRVRPESQHPAQERPRTRRAGRPRRRAGRDCRCELGGQAIEATEQAGFGVSAAVGLLAAIVVLLLTFGSLIAMGLPIVTALFGLGTGLGAIALFTHVVGHAELLLRARGDDRAGRGNRLRAVHPDPLPRGLPHPRTDVRRRARVGRAGDGHRRARRPVRRHDRRDRAAGDDAARRRLPLRRGDLRLDRGAAGDARLADAAAGAADDGGRPGRAAESPHARSAKPRAGRSSSAEARAVSPAIAASRGAVRCRAPGSWRSAARPARRRARGCAGARSCSADRGRSRSPPRS